MATNKLRNNTISFLAKFNNAMNTFAIYNTVAFILKLIWVTPDISASNLYF